MDVALLLPALTALLCVASGYFSAQVSGGQQRFAAINLLLFCLAALAAAVGIAVTLRRRRRAATVAAEAAAVKAEKAANRQRKTAAKGKKGAAAAVADGPTAAASSGWSWLGIIGVLFLAWTWVSSLASGRFVAAFTGQSTSLIGLAALTAAALVGMYASLEREAFTRMLSYAAPVVLGLTAFATLLLPDNIINGQVIDGVHLGFANTSELGLFYAMLTPWALNRTYRFTKGFWGDVSIRMVVMAVLGVSLFWNAMRMASIIVALCLLWYLITLFMETPTKARHILGACLGGGTLLGAVVAFAAALAGTAPVQFLSIRGQLWRMGLAALKRRLLIGFGADGYFAACTTVAKPTNWFGGSPQHFSDGTTDPHNALMLVLVSFGIIGFLLLVAFIVAWCKRAVETLHADNPAYPAAFLSAAGGFLILCTMPTTDNLLPFFMLAAGTAVAAGTRPVLGGRLGMILGRVAAGFAVLVVLMGAYDACGRIALGPQSTYLSAPSFSRVLALQGPFGWDPYISHALNTAYVYSTATGEQAASESAVMTARDYEKATRADRYNPYYRLGYLNVLYRLGTLKSDLVAASAVTVKTRDGLRLALLEQAARTYPAQPDIDIELAYARAQAGDTAGARSALNRVLAFGTYGTTIWAKPIAQVRTLLTENKVGK